MSFRLPSEDFVALTDVFWMINEEDTVLHDVYRGGRVHMKGDI